MKQILKPSVIMALMLFIIAICPGRLINGQDSAPAPQDQLDRQSIRSDLNQLKNILEDSHPDPYSGGGGKIAFYRRFQDLWAAVAEEGWSRSTFHSRLQPLLASLGDSHTALLPLAQIQDAAGLPFSFKIVENDLIIESVNHHSLQNCLGARLRRIAGLTVEELLERQARLRGCENPYTRMVFLIFSSFSRLSGLKTLIPEWADDQALTITLEHDNGRSEEISLSLPIASDKPASIPSAITLPTAGAAEFSWGFLDSDPKTAILVINGMETYREKFELAKSLGFQNIEAQASAVYQRFNPGKTAKEWPKLMAGIPSASECFSGLVQAMKKQGVRDLIVDLRKNTGGNSIMSDILIYMLYGETACLNQSKGYSISKDSPLWRSQYTQAADRPVDPGSVYDFSLEKKYRAAEKARTELGDTGWENMPGFWRIVTEGKFKKPLLNDLRVMIVSSPFTYSSGFNLLTALKAMGAETVGTPSAQAPNNFGDSLAFTLEKSRLNGYVSFKRILTYPDNEAIAKLLPVDHPLSLDRYRSSRNDPNAELLLAHELIQKPRAQR